MSEKAIQTLSNPLDFPLHGSRLIEASAGTGKTYTIAALFVRLAIGHGSESTAYKEPLQPKNILVMTFTKAATAELADRIRARLSEAAEYFRTEGHTSSDAFLHNLKQDCEAKHTQGNMPSLATLARQLDLAAQSMDEAAVKTIHGWCQKMVTEHAFASGSLFEQTVETDEADMKLNAAQDYFRRYVYGLDSSAVEPILNVLQDPEALVRKIGRPSDNAQEYRTELPGLVDAYQQSLEEAGSKLQALKGKYSSIAKALHELGESLPDKGNSGRKRAITALYQWVFGDTFELTIASADKKYIQPPDLNKKFKDEAPDNLDVLEELPDDMAVIQGIIKQAEAFLLEHAKEYIFARLAEIKQQAALMGHDDMLLRLRDALRGPNGKNLAQAIKQQFPVALVDEFQDTDPIQYEIFRRIYDIANNDLHSGIFLIGDPKQAIYSFRNADIFTYLEAKRATEGRHYSLSTNYRSTEFMVGAVNHLFTSAETHFQNGAFLYQKEIPFGKVHAHGQKRELRGLEGEVAPALQWHVCDEHAKNKDDYWLAAAHAYANTIAKLLNSKKAGFYEGEHRTPITPKDIAVLVGSAQEAKVIRAELSARGIRSVYLSERDSVYAQPVAKDLLAIVRACSQPRDPSKLRSALATSLLNFSMFELVRYQEDEQAWELAVEKFIDYHQMWEQQGILAVLTRVIHDFEVPKRLLSDEHTGERQLADTLHIAELLQEASRKLDGMDSLEAYFAEQVHEFSSHGVGFGSSARTNDESMQLRLESDDQLVKVITYHKSKGLQYPLVFMPFASYTAKEPYRIKNKLPTVYQDSATGKRNVAWDISSVAVFRQISKEILAEDIRKMYVALTRAQFATFVTLQSVGDPKVNPLFYLLYGDELAEQPDKGTEMNGVLERAKECWGSEPHSQVNALVQEAIENYQPPVQQAERYEVRTMPEHRGIEHWWVASYSALKYGSDWLAPQTPEEMNAMDEGIDILDRAFEEIEPRPDRIHELPKGAGPGTFLHELLEDAADAGFNNVAQDIELCRHLVEQRGQSPAWQPFHDNLVQWLHAYVSTHFPCNLSGGSFALSNLTTYQAEPEFWFGVANVDTLEIDKLVKQYVLPEQSRPPLEQSKLNGMLKGFIDLVFEYEGQYYVADYKSNWLGESDLNYSFSAMQKKILASRYDLQYVIYTAALHKLLKTRLGQNYDYERDIGGIVYLFMRGHGAESRGAFYDKPPKALIEKLDRMFVAPDTASNMSSSANGVAYE